MRCNRITLALVTAALVWSGLPVAAAPLGEDLRLEIVRERIQRQFLEELLGRSRWQRLNDARFELELLERNQQASLDHDPARADAIKKAFRHCGAKLAREYVEKRLRLEERRDHLRDRIQKRDGEGGTGSSLDISPRIRVGSRSSLGARLRWRSARSRVMSGLALNLIRDLSGDNVNLGLSYRDPKLEVFLSLHSDHRDLGRAGEFGMRFSF